MKMSKALLERHNELCVRLENSSLGDKTRKRLEKALLSKLHDGKSISTVPTTPAEEEFCGTYAAVFAVENQIHEDYKELVYSVAIRHTHSAVELEDVVNEGHIGLSAAIRRYRVSSPMPFGNYARWKIGNAIKHNLLKQMIGPVGMNRAACEKFWKIRRDMSDTEDIDKVAEENNIPRAAVLSWVATEPAGDPAKIIEQVAGNLPGPYDRQDDIDRKAAVKKLLGAKLLTDRQRFVINRYFGTDGKPAANEGDIAKELNITRSAVSACIKKALRRIRATHQCAELKKSNLLTH